MKGPEESLTIASPVSSSSGQNSVAAAKAEPQKLFEILLLECKPVACKSRRYSAEDTKFIKNEIFRLLVAEIIEPARSPWRAQVQVVNHGSKKMSVIDYSPTINRFTILDAYPLPSIENLPRGSSRQILQLAGLAVRLLSNTAFARRKALHRF